MLFIFEYALVSLARRWQKHLILVLIYALLVGFYTSIILLTNGLRKEAILVLQDVPELWIQKISGGRLQPISKNLIDSLQNIRGVAKVYQRIWGYMPESSTGAVFTVMGIADSITEIPFIQNNFSKPLADDEVLVGSGLLTLRNLQIGDYLSLSDLADSIQNFKIVGSFEAKADILTKDLLVFNVKKARSLLDLSPDQATDIALKIRNLDEVDNIGNKIDNRFPFLRVVSKQQLTATYTTLFSWRGGLLLYGSLMTLLAFMILIYDRASSLGLQERKELGILKSVGWGINHVLWLKISEAIIISFTATFVGLLLGYGHIFFFDASLLKPFMAGWSVLYPSFYFPISVEISDILLLVLLSIVPYLTVAIIPAWLAAITDPAEVMR
jgi:ABC-type lipoprotein release transport system permease subunit